MTPTTIVASAEPISVALLTSPTSSWPNPCASRYAGNSTATNPSQKLRNPRPMSNGNALASTPAGSIRRDTGPRPAIEAAVLGVRIALTPRVERVVDDHAVPQLFVIVVEIARQPHGNCVKTARFGCEVEPAGVRPAHDLREFQQRGVGQSILLQERIETAQLAVVAQFDVRYVVWEGTGFPRYLQYVIARHIKELGLLVEEID